MSRHKFQKKDPIEHCLTRPDMYVGSTRFRNSEEYVADYDEVFTIYKKLISTCPALARIFIEILSNATDNVERSKQQNINCTKIKVTVDKDTGLTSVWNDGDIIPVEIHPDEKCYNHTLIFGNLLTGSNYDDEEERTLAGRNGLGGKLTNIFSTYFMVEGYDPVNQKTFKQTWNNNMKTVNKHTIRKKTTGPGYTCISWIPDFKQFGITGYTDDIISLYRKFCIDCAMVSKVQVTFNNVTIPCKNINTYAEFYNRPTDDKIIINVDNYEVAITSCENFEFIGFVNGIYTKLGGTHIDAWSECIFRTILDKVNSKLKKDKAAKLNINDIKQFFRIFVNARINRPEFDGQDKNKLESAVKKIDIKQSIINNIMKWKIMHNVEDIIKAKEMLVLKRSERKKKTVKIDGLDPANNAGGKYSSECSLFVCEGLSAKTYVVAGIGTGVYGKSGRDWFGVLPVTGKILNVRNATSTSIAANKVISSFIQTTGLKYDTDYTKDENFNSLYYGKVIIITDADVDGIHIESLLMNLIQNLFPTLLDRKQPYLVSMKTPIARVFLSKNKHKLFYDEIKFNEFIKSQEVPPEVKYYKGLGTTKEEDVPDTFGSKMIEYYSDSSLQTTMNKIFHKNYANERKDWLSNFNPNISVNSLDDINTSVSTMNISDFLNNETIKFSHQDCCRSIPHCIDGLKESQRKILFSVFKKGLKFTGKSCKVAQLSGYTAEHSNYHHGEQNLQDTMINMAANYVGVNNIPLLYPDGGFGTRLEGGKDAASARYIYTKLEGLTELIFSKKDEPILNYVIDDGDKVQPKFYVPIIPMILVNGCVAGIGTGWSCNIPCYNPLDIIECIKDWLDDKPLRNIEPWYRNFKGSIEKVGSKYITEGVIENTKNNSIKKVTELPIGTWTNRFKEYIEDLVCSKHIKAVKNHSTTSEVEFTLHESKDGMKLNNKNLNLQSYLYVTNMVLFNDESKIVKYSNTHNIIDNFCRVRFEYYTKRKEHELNVIKLEIENLSNKQRFVEAVVNDNIIIMKRKESDIIDELNENNYSECENLLKMSVKNFTQEKIDELNKNITKLSADYETLEHTSEKQIWLSELNTFADKYAKWLGDMSKRKTKKN